MSSEQHAFTRRLRSCAALLTYLPWTLRLIWTASGRWTLAWAILLAVQGLLPAVIVYLTRLLVDSLVAVIGTGRSWESLRPVVFLAALTAAVTLLSELMESASI